ncbi:hypothetical protein [Runella zeae]|nr:hypothetical protein [Runella zeae]
MLNNLKYKFLPLYYQIIEKVKLIQVKSRYRAAKRLSISTIKRIDNQFIPKNISEIRLFAIMRNESLRLPHFMTYYKNLGVERFF